MPNPPEYLIILTTCPDARTAEAIATHLVEAGLAACVNILPGVRSIYKWKGILETSDEQLLLIKTRSYAHVEQALRDKHPYELPEVVAIPIVAGSAEYLAWLSKGVKET